MIHDVGLGGCLPYLPYILTIWDLVDAYHTYYTNLLTLRDSLDSQILRPFVGAEEFYRGGEATF